MAISQKKSSQNKDKRKREEITDKDKKIVRKTSKTKKLKIDKEIEHVLGAEQQKTNVSKIKSTQDISEKQIKIVSKTAKKKKNEPKIKTMKLGEKDDAEDIEAKLSKNHIQQCISAKLRVNENEHISDAKQQQTNVSVKRKANRQNTNEKEIKVLNKIAKKKKNVSQIKSMKLDKKDDAEDIEAELKSHIQQCVSAKLKVDKNIEHMLDAKQQKTNVSRKSNIQDINEKEIKVVNKTAKKKKNMPEIMSMKLNEKDNAEDIEAESKNQQNAKQEKMNVSRKRKSNTQDISEKEIKVINKKVKTKKNMPKRLKTMKLDEKDNTEDIAAGLSKNHIQECISAIFHLIEEELKNKNNLFTEAVQPVFMQVTCIKISKVPRRQMRILLPHSIVTSDDEVALFVCDLERGRRKDYEPTVEHYTNLLTEHRCTRVNEIIPMTRVKTEFDQFELKRKLAASYDYFLVDSRIAGHLSHLLGKEFTAKRKLPTCVRMGSKDLKHEIDYALRKTNMALHSDGDCHIVQIGNTSMKQDEILENILATCKNLSANYPGGWANIRSLRLKGTTTLGLPFYMTLKNKNTVKPPVVNAKRPKAHRDVKGELSTFVKDTNVTVKPDGEIILEQITRKKDGRKPREN